MKYKHAVLGGTFDRLHVGHKIILDRAFLDAEKVTIGITMPLMQGDKVLAHIIESYNIRLSSTDSYLKSKDYSVRANIIPLIDIYGSAVSDNTLEAIYVTVKSRKNAEKINKLRGVKGFKTLEIIDVPLVIGSDSEIVSSTRIRRGEIDRDGNSYFDIFKDQKKIILPVALRPLLKKPFGNIIRRIKHLDKYLDNKSMLTTVGDITTLNLLKAGYNFDLSIIDMKTGRHDIDPTQKEILSILQKSRLERKAINEAGTIERRSVGAIRNAINSFLESKLPQSISITGEEDLLTIPIVLLSPLESIILYGQKDKGIVVLRVTEKKKHEFKRLLSKML